MQLVRCLFDLVCAFAGLIVAQAAEQLGQEVLLRHFLVTVQGRTGYLEPQWEECSVTGTAASLAGLAPVLYLAEGSVALVV